MKTLAGRILIIIGIILALSSPILAKRWTNAEVIALSGTLSEKAKETLDYHLARRALELLTDAQRGLVPAHLRWSPWPFFFTGLGILISGIYLARTRRRHDA